MRYFCFEPREGEADSIIQVTALPTQSLVVFRGRVLCVATEQNSEYNMTSEVGKGWKIK